MLCHQKVHLDLISWTSKIEERPCQNIEAKHEWSGMAGRPAFVYIPDNPDLEFLAYNILIINNYYNISFG